jgi:hypothetical protein
MSTSIQSRFALALRTPGLELRGLRAPAPADPRRRLDVHRNNSMVSLVDALAATFPVTLALVGEDFFRDMARERVRADPPRSPILFRYGEGFPGFVQDYAPAAVVPYLADVARLEYLRVQCHHAADAQAVPVAEFHALLSAPERLADLRMTLHPASAWLRSDHAVHALWRAHQGLDALARADLADIDPDSAEAVLVTRPRWDVQVHRIDARATHALDALREGAPLGAALSVVPACADEPATLLTELLTLLLRHDLVVALHPPGE